MTALLIVLSSMSEREGIISLLTGIAIVRFRVAAVRHLHDACTVF
jgi:hypothetical protein